MKSWYLLAVIVIFVSGCGLLKPRVVSNSQNPSSFNKQSEAYAKLAAGYLQIGRIDLAKVEAQKAIEINPSSGLANNVYGLVLMNIGKTRQAENYLRNAVAIEPDNPNYKNNLALLYCKNNRAIEGMRLLSQALADPLYARRQNSLINAGICSESLKRPVEAEKYYKQALVYPRYRLAAQERLASLYYKSNRFQDAYQELYSFINQLDPPSPQQYQLAIMISTAAGKTKEAEIYQQRLKADYPEFVKSLAPAINSNNSNSFDFFSSIVNQNNQGDFQNQIFQNPSSNLNQIPPQSPINQYQYNQQPIYLPFQSNNSQAILISNFNINYDLKAIHLTNSIPSNSLSISSIS